jgi:hypothetical protein
VKQKAVEDGLAILDDIREREAVEKNPFILV